MDGDHVLDGDHREIAAPRLARLGTDAARAGRPLTAAQHVRANHEILVGVEPFAWADKTVPPAGFAGGDIFLRTVARRMSVAGQGVADKNRVVALRRELAVSLIGDGNRPQISRVGEDQRTGRSKERGELGADNPDRAGPDIGRTL